MKQSKSVEYLQYHTHMMQSGDPSAGFWGIEADIATNFTYYKKNSNPDNMISKSLEKQTEIRF